MGGPWSEDGWVVPIRCGEEVGLGVYRSKRPNGTYFVVGCDNENTSR